MPILSREANEAKGGKMGVVIALQRGVTRDSRVREVEQFVAQTMYEHEEAGFHYHGAVPIIMYGLPGNPDPLTEMHTMATYVHEYHAIYFNLAAIFPKRPIPLTPEELIGQPKAVRELLALGQSGLTPDHPFFDPRTKVELRAIVSNMLGQFYFDMMSKEFPESWLLVNDTKERKPDLAAPMVKAGVVTFFQYMWTPPAENISENVWTTYDDDDGFAQSGGIRAWFLEHVAHPFFAPLIKEFGEAAICYFFTHPLHVGGRHGYELAKFSTYLEQAQKDLWMTRT